MLCHVYVYVCTIRTLQDIVIQSRPQYMLFYVFTPWLFCTHDVMQQLVMCEMEVKNNKLVQEVVKENKKQIIIVSFAFVQIHVHAMLSFVPHTIYAVHFIFESVVKLLQLSCCVCSVFCCNILESLTLYFCDFDILLVLCTCSCYWMTWTKIITRAAD